MLSIDELNRYKRQIVLPEFGLAGQEKLKSASVLVIGAGGLGSPLSLYLTSAGIGKIGIIDFDQVDDTNLQRQILFKTRDRGANKAEKAVEVLQQLNPYTKFEIYPYKLDAGNILELISGYDVIADGSDNFSTRYMVNDACVLSGKPLVSAAVFRFEGQITVYNHKNGPCLRCLYPEMEKSELVQSCADAGVIGANTGVMGSLQANEVIKIITDTGRSLSGRVVVFDALEAGFNEFSFKRNPACSGKCKIIKEIVAAEYLCEMKHTVELVSPAELNNKIIQKDLLLLIDLREAGEGSIPSSVRIPKEDVERYIQNVQDREIILYCDIGIRSEILAAALLEKGYKLKSLDGGYYEWLEFVSKK